MALPRTGPIVVVKVGGSHAADRARVGLILKALAASPVRSVIVPGGGPFADAVREAQAALAFSDALAHRLALAAMGHFAEVLVELFPRLVLAPSRREIDAAHAGGMIPVWRPDRLLAGRLDVPESWALTSDSLAARLAGELDASALLLVKSLDGPAVTTAADLTAAGITDDLFPTYADRLGCPVRMIGPGSLGALDDLLADPAAPVGTQVLPPGEVAGRSDGGPRP